MIGCLLDPPGAGSPTRFRSHQSAERGAFCLGGVAMAWVRSALRPRQRRTPRASQSQESGRACAHADDQALTADLLHHGITKSAFAYQFTQEIVLKRLLFDAG